MSLAVCDVEERRENYFVEVIKSESKIIFTNGVEIATF